MTSERTTAEFAREVKNGTLPYTPGAVEVERLAEDYLNLRTIFLSQSNYEANELDEIVVKARGV